MGADDENNIYSARLTTGARTARQMARSNNWVGRYN